MKQYELKALIEKTLEGQNVYSGNCSCSTCGWNGEASINALIAALKDRVATADEIWKEAYTTAPEAYDEMGTRTLATCGWFRGHADKQVRKVEIDPENFLWQSARYGSGLHPTWDVEEFKYNFEAGYILDHIE